MTKPPPCTRFSPSLFDSTSWPDHVKARTICAACTHVTECLEKALDIAGEREPGNPNERGPDGTWAGLLWRDGGIVTDTSRKPSKKRKVEAA